MARKNAAVEPRSIVVPGTPAALAEALREDSKLGPQLVFSEHLPGSEVVYGELDPPLAAPIGRALLAGGARRLYSHQAAGIAAVRRGENVLITTPTASGKSLVFQVPPLEEAIAGGDGRALFLFPLKALGQDQRGKLCELAAAAGLPPEIAGCEIYDGDTPTGKRAEIRRRFPRVVVSNPDMLHLGILGSWTNWAPFLADLRWLVLDELHTYRGIFGSHFHHVLQRLLRLCRSVGSEPVIIGSSATAANAREFAETLTSRPFTAISESGAPREGRHLLLFRPEASPYTLTLQLFVRCLEAGLKTIVFTKARRITELLYSWLRRQEPRLAGRVANYRAGFLAEERRRIEADLFAGKIDGVISTSALEMGIDVGGLDACILVGYPGSMMATWQRSGRVGRAGKESITALVALPDALDQYLLDHPREFLGRPCERLIVDPENDPVSRAHLVCAASEMPLDSSDDAYLAPHRERVGLLIDQGHLMQRGDPGEPGDEVEVVSLRRRPQRHVNLRGTGAVHTILVAGRTLGTIDGVRVLHECHPGAVYLHGGRQYLVATLELEERRVLAEATEVDYFTTPLTEKETEILEVLGERSVGEDDRLRAGLGRFKVTERVVGFERKRIQTQEAIDRTALDLPPIEYETVGLWWWAPRAVEETLRRRGEHYLGALHASEHAAISLCPLLALCDRNDIGGISYPMHWQLGSGGVFLYDGHPGGVGIMARVFADLPELLRRVVALIEGCPCETGCPSCIQSPKCGNGNRPLDKVGAARALRLLLGAEEAAVGWEWPELSWRGAKEEGEEVVDGREESGERWQEVVVASAAPHLSSPRSQPAPAQGGGTPANVHGVFPAASELDEAVPPPGAGGGWIRGEDRRGAGPESPVPVSVPISPSSPSPLPRTVLFDLETLRSAADVGGWHNAHRMGMALGVVCFLEEGRFEVFGERQVRELVAALRSATLVVGYNIRRFDYAVLAGYTGEDYARLLPTLDLLDEVAGRLGFRVGMGKLAQETLGAGKSADGLQSLAWVKEGRLDLVEAYCRRDVEVLRDLYLHGRREGYLLARDDRRNAQLRVQVEW
jgi:DEAD/DEAH box helicase domain-containing protein